MKGTCCHRTLQKLFYISWVSLNFAKVILHQVILGQEFISYWRVLSLLSLLIFYHKTTSTHACHWKGGCLEICAQHEALVRQTKETRWHKAFQKLFYSRLSQALNSYHTWLTTCLSCGFLLYPVHCVKSTLLQPTWSAYPYHLIFHIWYLYSIVFLYGIPIPLFPYMVMLPKHLNLFIMWILTLSSTLCEIDPATAYVVCISVSFDFSYMVPVFHCFFIWYTYSLVSLYGYAAQTFERQSHCSE